MENPKQQLIPAELMPEIDLRIEKIQNAMRHHKAGALLLSDNTNIYYTSGRFFRGYVYIPAKGSPTYFVIRPNDLEPGDADMYYIRKPELIPGIMAENGIEMPDSIGLEFDSATYSDIKRLSAVFLGLVILNASPILRTARMTKTSFEIARMKEDGAHQSAAYHRIMHVYKENMTDVEFQIEIERILRLEGCLGYSRTSGNLMEINLGSVISGDNADTPTPYDFAMGGAGTDPSLPVGADGTTMRNGTTVMIDMNGSFNGYQTDMTRVWRIGEIPELAYKAHDCSIRILRELENSVRPGMPLSEIYIIAERIVEADNLQAYFMGHRQKAGFVGHGVGIELNEQPALTPRAKGNVLENMTLAIEPKFVIPHVGAVGIENTYVVTSDGLKTLTVFPDDIQNLL